MYDFQPDFVAAILIPHVQFIASWVAIFTIERFGRRNLMMFGAAGQAASMAFLSGTTSVKAGEPNSVSWGIVAAVFLFVFNSFFAVGWLGMTCMFKHVYLLSRRSILTSACRALSG
jgi:hypothetical protein